MALKVNISDTSIYVKEGQVKMVYLFMSLDGGINEENLVRFNQLTNEMEILGDSREKVIVECEKILGKTFDKEDRIGLIYQSIFNWGKSNKETEKIQSLWLLVDSAFFGGIYTSDEKRILRNLSRDWEIEDNVAVLLEMEDTAETILELEKHREWLKTTNYPYDYIRSYDDELEKNKKELVENISLIVCIG